MNRSGGCRSYSSAERATAPADTLPICYYSSQLVDNMRRTVLASIMALTMSVPILSKGSGGSSGGNVDANFPTESYVLPNGLRVVLQPERSNTSVVIRLNFSSGGATGKAGLAHLSEHLALSGSAEFPEPARFIESLGGYSDASTYIGSTSYYVAGDADDFAILLRLQATRLALADSITEELLEREKKIVISERRQRMDSGLEATHLMLRGLFGERHAYSRFVFGTEEDIQSTTLDEAQSFLQRYYRSNNAVLVVAGGLPSSVKEQIEKQFGRYSPATDIIATSASQSLEEHGGSSTVKANVGGLRLTLAWTFPGGAHSSRPIASVLAAVLAYPPDSPHLLRCAASWSVGGHGATTRSRSGPTSCPAERACAVERGGGCGDVGGVGG